MISEAKQIASAATAKLIFFGFSTLDKINKVKIAIKGNIKISTSVIRKVFSEDDTKAKLNAENIADLLPNKFFAVKKHAIDVIHKEIIPNSFKIKRN